MGQKELTHYGYQRLAARSRAAGLQADVSEANVQMLSLAMKHGCAAFLLRGYRNHSQRTA